MSFEVFQGAPGLRLAARGTLFIALFRGWPTPASLRRLADAQDEAARRAGEAVRVLIIIPPVDVEPRDPEMQKLQPQAAGHTELLREGAEASERLKERVRASAMVILPRGVLGVMIRSFMGAVQLMTPGAVPLKTFDAFEPALSFLGVDEPGLREELERWSSQP